MIPSSVWNQMVSKIVFISEKIDTLGITKLFPSGTDVKMYNVPTALIIALLM
jgi:hypothetical protein